MLPPSVPLLECAQDARLDCLLGSSGGCPECAQDARLDFLLGSSGACPIFDLRYEIDEVILLHSF